jgi:hypothetical protein
MAEITSITGSELLKTGHASQKEAMALFDSLREVMPEEMLGTWTGTELFCGHPLEGLLTTCNWYGKRFESATVVYPMLFARKNGSLFSTNPARMPMSVTLNRMPRPIVRFLFNCGRFYLKSNLPGARLETANYRGKLSAAMVYTSLPVIDHFRRVDENRVLGIMELATDKSGLDFFFLLTRS